MIMSSCGLERVATTSAALEKPDRGFKHPLAQFGDLLDVGASDLTVCELERGLDHQEREGLCPLAEELQVLHLGVIELIPRPVIPSVGGEQRQDSDGQTSP